MTRVTIALAAPRPARSLDDGLERVGVLTGDAAARGAAIVCFPEAYLPGLRGLDFPVPAYDAGDEARVMKEAAALARAHGIAMILSFEQIVEDGRRIAAAVFDAEGTHLGVQSKTQLDPSEEQNYVPGRGRQLFETAGLRFGITICHEGWRYPETVRWAAVRGAHVVFHPQHTGSETSGAVPGEWAARGGAYYEQAMMMRSRENAIWFASVNYALRYPEAATAIIAPDGTCAAYLPYATQGVLVHAIELEQATGLLAKRWAPERNG